MGVNYQAIETLKNVHNVQDMLRICCVQRICDSLFIVKKLYPKYGTIR